MIRAILKIGALGMFFSACAAQNWYTIRESGDLRFGDDSPAFIDFRPADWKKQGRQNGDSIRPDQGFPNTESNSWQLAGNFRVPGGVWLFTEKIAREDAGTFQADWTVSSAVPIPTGLLSLNIELPVGRMAGYCLRYGEKAFTLPVDALPGKHNLIVSQKTNELILPMRDFDVKITGDITFSMLDARSMPGGWGNYIVRLHFSPGHGKISSSGLSLKFEKLPASAPVSAGAEAYELLPSQEWKALDFPVQVKPGSILDFSRLSLDAPAGKYGHVVIRNGHFEFEKRPGVPVRFLGVNLCYGANFPEKKDAAAFADELAALGYNAVRFHLMDGALTKDQNDPEYLTLNADLLDRNDYFWHCLKERGFYISSDLYCVRRQKINGRDEFHNPVKMNLLLEEDAMRNQEEFVRNFFSHINPYTKMARKDDPALFSISLINEDSFRFILPARLDRTHPIRTHFERKFQEYDAGKTDVKNRQGRFVEFIMLRAYNRLGKLLKDMGCKALLTDQNCLSNLSLTVLRNSFDYVDNHGYHDHQTYPVKKWSYPMGFRNTGAIPDGRGGGIDKMMATRIFGKPFSISEYNFCFPNRYRAECGMIYGAYAALQDWDMLFRYNYAERYPEQGPGRTGVAYDLRNDPMQLLSEKLIALLFLRGDVSPAKLKLPILVRPDVPSRLSCDAGYPAHIAMAGMVGQIGSVVADSATPDTVFDSENPDSFLKELKSLPEWGKAKLDLPERLARSSTGEILLHGAGERMTVVTPRTEALLKYQAGELSGKYLKIDNQAGFVLVSASAMDGKDLHDSKHILLFHLTNSGNTGTRFSNRTMTRLEAPGKFPALLRHGVAEVSLTLSGQAEVKLYAVGLDGARMTEIPVRKNGENYCFTLDNHAQTQAVAAYELVRKEKYAEM